MPLMADSSWDHFMSDFFPSWKDYTESTYKFMADDVVIVILFEFPFGPVLELFSSSLWITNAKQMDIPKDIQPLGWLRKNNSENV